jgi:hypothetical protein
VVNTNDTNKILNDNTNSHIGTPFVILDIITIGDVKGIMEPQNTVEESGSIIVLVAIK